MDATDRQLVFLLQQDSRLPNAQLAEKLNISASACWRRVKALEQAGVIKRYAAVVDPKAMGLGFEAMVHVHLTRHDGMFRHHGPSGLSPPRALPRYRRL